MDAIAHANRLRRRPPGGRSKRLFVEPVADTPWSRRFRAILSDIVADDLDGANNLTEGQRQLARRCATLAVTCEQLENDAASGKAIDIVLFGMLVDRLGRTLSRLIGLKRPHRDNGLSLGALIAADQEVERQLLVKQRRERQRLEDDAIDVDVS
jgi:hypothetical protein